MQHEGKQVETWWKKKMKLGPWYERYKKVVHKAKGDPTNCKGQRRQGGAQEVTNSLHRGAPSRPAFFLLNSSLREGGARLACAQVSLKGKKACLLYLIPKHIIIIIIK
jgi:hypothetical protein